MLTEAGNIFLANVRLMESIGKSDQSNPSCSETICDHMITIEVIVNQADIQLDTKTDESYHLAVSTTSINKTMTAYITANTFFGARHAMETLSQLMAWDDLVNSLVIVQNATINDRPAFPYRGLLIDTSRSFIEIPMLKRIIDGLSYNKMNVLHWHLTDAESFPFVSRREPLMAIYGAYSPRQVYRPRDVQELVEYAQVRGVRIIPELDGIIFTIIIEFRLLNFSVLNRPGSRWSWLGLGPRLWHGKFDSLLRIQTFHQLLLFTRLWRFESNQRKSL